jgi:CubicO group peptidase (beta-lactamase class C family)
MMIDGSVTPGFERVADTFAENFERRGELGAALAVYHHGDKVVDLWGGIRNKDTGEVWDETTMMRTASSTKGITAICANLLIQQGLLDPDATVASYWPEFKANGKEGVLVRWALSHQAGVPVVEDSESFTKEDVFAWDPVVEAIAAAKPVWKPGAEHGYHGQSYGYIVGEVIRRITGRTIGTYLQDEIAKPLGIEVFIGLPDEYIPRVAHNLYAYPPEGAPTRPQPQMMADNGFGARVFMFSHLKPDYTTPEWLRIEMPSANGVTTARSLAKLYGSLVGEVDGHRLFTPETVERATTLQTKEGAIDRIMMAPSRYGLGFSLPTDAFPLLGAGSFGHAGAGGIMAFADADHEVGFAFGCNIMGDFERAAALIDALRSSLG